MRTWQTVFRENRAAVLLTVAFLGIAITALVYRVLVWQQLKYTAALFVGLPTLLALVVLWGTHPNDFLGTLLKVTTLFVLISGPLLNEGMICVLMASPIFFFVVLAVGYFIQALRGTYGGGNNSKLQGLVFLPFLLMSLEGTSDTLSLPRHEAVTVRRLLPTGMSEVEAALAESPDVTGSAPAFFHLGFPLPASAEGRGLTVGDSRMIGFITPSGRTSTMTLRVTERWDGGVRFAVADDRTPMRNWLAWQDSVVEWRPADGGVQVTWTVHFQRKLDPMWYFSPLERYGVGLAADYLIDAAATPR